MKRFLQIVISALFLGLFIVPTFAQDTAETAASTGTTLTYVVIIVLALLLVCAQVYGAYVTRFLAKLVPPETAASIYESGVRMAIEAGLNQAAATESELDDEFFLNLAKGRGLPVIKHPDGSYTVQIPSAPDPN